MRSEYLVVGVFSPLLGPAMNACVWLKEAPGHPVSSIILLYCCLDSWTITLASIIVLATVELTVQIIVYSFCLVHFRTTFFTRYSLEIFGGIVFHARMIDVVDIKQTLWHVSGMLIP